MRTVEDSAAGLLNLSLLVASVLYAVEVLSAYFRPEKRQRPEIDSSQPLRTGSHWLVWAGVMAADFMVKLSRPLFGMLSEASADVGEWAITRYQARLTTHPPRNH
jgi:hypothetical protein